MTSAGRILAVPTRPAERDKFLEDEGKEIMKSFAMRCSVDKNGLPLKSNKPLNGEEEEELLMILLALSDIEGLTKATAQQIKLKRTLEVVLNKVQVGPRRFAFPTKAIEIAQQAFDRYESEGWGADPENDLLDPEHGSEGSPSPPPAKRRRITSINDNSPRKKQQVALAPPNHAIYGRNGIMRGISVQYGKTTSYKFGKDDPTMRFILFN
jgi:hypothetical protein